MSKRKTFQELEFKDAFMFAQVMSDPETCRAVLERVLGIPIWKVVIRSEYSIQFNSDYRSVRLDVFADDAENNVYDIEMQVADQKNVPKRSRMYQGQMDVAALQPGEDFNNLPQSMVIFICCFDPCGRGRYRYTFCEQCVEDGEPLEDGTCKVFLNTRGTNPDEVPEELVQFLHYVDEPAKIPHEGRDPLIDRVKEQLKRLKRDRRMEARYMQFQEMLRNERAEGDREATARFCRLIACMDADKRLAELPRLSADPEFLKEMLEYYHII